MKKVIFSLFIPLILVTAGIEAQVTIGIDKEPVEGALLQLKQSEVQNGSNNANKGLGLPRVQLSKKDQLFPMFGTEGSVINGYDTGKASIDQDHIGLLVYNVTDDPNEPLCPGLYVWDGLEWVRLPEPCPTLGPELLNSPNCYIVKPGGTSAKIPVGKPYLLWKQNSALGNIELEGKVTVDLIWQDTQDLIESVSLVDGDKGGLSELQVKTKNNGKTGNALVGVWVGPNGNIATDDLRWSWHIWVTDYDPDTNSNGTTYAHNNGDADGNYVFMDRNIGATSTSSTDISSMGLMYQWGRKDPFTADSYFYAEGTERILYNINNNPMTEVNEYAQNQPVGTGVQHEVVTENNNLKNSIMNPLIFYFGVFDSNANNPVDWYSVDATGASSSDNLWGAGGDKSPYDPCPAGWRVPQQSSGGKSPWYQFRSVPEGSWMGESPAGFSENGVALNALPGGVTQLGFYPFGAYRKARAFFQGCSPVGGPAGSNYVGGLFEGCAINGNESKAYYWTATPVANSVNAKADYFFYDTSGLYEGGMIDPKNISRATGSFVRCVKE